MHAIEQKGLAAFSSGTEAFLVWARAAFPQLSLASSFGLEDVLLIDMAARLKLSLRIFMLDTGRLHQETYELVDRVRRRYQVSLEIFAPDSAGLEAMLRAEGMNHFYESIPARQQCCQVRKVLPLKRALAGQDAWITGLRRSQSTARSAVSPITWEEGLWKLSPLADFSLDDVWAYIKKHDVPYNPLHDKGFPTIGCAPCTRAVMPGEDIRAGRWWWEEQSGKECGLHSRPNTTTVSRDGQGVTQVSS